MADDEPLQRLLAALNEWAALRGGPDVADTGEIGSRIAELRRQIGALGGELEERDGRFVLVGQPPQRPEGPR